MLESCGVHIDIDGFAHHPASAEAIGESAASMCPVISRPPLFFIVAGLLGASAAGLLIQNVGLNPTRTGLLDIFAQHGREYRNTESARERSGNRWRTC